MKTRHTELVAFGGLPLGLSILFFCVAAPRALAGESVLLSVGESWRYFKGTEGPPADWAALGFDDGDWLEGPTGIGYGDKDDATVLDDMPFNYVSFFCRKIFQIGDAAAIEMLFIGIDYDDGFIAYINGEEVARSLTMGDPGTPVSFDALSGSHEAGTPEIHKVGLSKNKSLLKNGDNVFAVQVHNSTLGSSDASFIPSLFTRAQPLCPRTLSCKFDLAIGSVLLAWTNEGVSDSITILRNGEEIAVGLSRPAERFSDLAPPSGVVTYEVISRIEGFDCPALECDVQVPDSRRFLIAEGDSWRFFRGIESPPASWADLGFDDSSWEQGPTGIGFGDDDDATVLEDMQGNYFAFFARAEFEIEDLENVQSLILQYRAVIVLHLQRQRARSRAVQYARGGHRSQNRRPGAGRGRCRGIRDTKGPGVGGHPCHRCQRPQRVRYQLGCFFCPNTGRA